MKTYEIWTEGHVATGESGSAQFIGTAQGASFIEACHNFTHPADLIREWDGLVMVKKGDPLKLDAHRPNPSIWACRLYDNEIDARKSFG